MSDDANLTLPGTIPGLLRRGSPVLAVWGEEAIEDGEYSASGVVLSTRDVGDVSVAYCGWDDGDADQSAAIDTLHLDLTDPTGRSHAAWWLAAQSCVAQWPGGYHHLDALLGDGHYWAACAASENEEMTPEDIACLRRVVLHVAGLPLT